MQIISKFYYKIFDLISDGDKCEIFLSNLSLSSMFTIVKRPLYWLDLSRIAGREQEQRDAFEIARLLTKGRHRMKKEAINGEMDASRKRLVRSKSAHLPYGMQARHIKTCTRSPHTDTYVHTTIRSCRVVRENRLRTFTSADPSEAPLLERGARKSDLLQAS